MKYLIYMLLLILISSIALAEVVRTGSGDTVTYQSTKDIAASDKMYWAIDETVCAGMSIISCTTGSGPCCISPTDICTTHAWASITSTNQLRVVVSTPDGSNSIEDKVTLKLAGNSVCTLNNGDYVESKTGDIMSSPASIAGIVALSFGCTVDGDVPPCDEVTSSELLSYIGLWEQDLRTSVQLLDLIAVWEAS